MWTMAFTGDLWRVCSSPISDLRILSTVSILPLKTSEEQLPVTAQPRLGRAALRALVTWVARHHDGSTPDNGHDLGTTAGADTPADRGPAQSPAPSPSRARFRCGGPRS
jgi:hypothetical protein